MRIGGKGTRQAEGGKEKKQDSLRARKHHAVQEKYTRALTYIDMYHSPACWRTKSDAKKEFKKLESKTARLDAVKEQQRIRVIGFGWDDLHHPWSVDGDECSPEQLRDHLINKIIPEQSKQRIPEKTTMELPSRNKTKQLGTRTVDADGLDSRYADEKKKASKGAEKMREDLEADGNIDRYEKMQPKQRSKIGQAFVGTEIEQLWEYIEKNKGKEIKVIQWCRGEVVGVKKEQQGTHLVGG